MDDEKLYKKAHGRIQLNSSLIAIAIGTFFLTINLKPMLLLKPLVLLQLVIAIPCLLTSTLSYIKASFRDQVRKWDILAWFTFMLGYAFILDVVGILIKDISGPKISIIFFLCSWLLALMYSFVDISYSRAVVKERILKDSLFILIQLIFGVFVVLGII